MPSREAANWVANPEDVVNLIKFFHDQRSRVGEGGNWEQTVLNEAANHMAKLGPPLKGGPKTDKSIATKWKDIRKLYEAILQMKQKIYPDENRDAWKNFSRAHRLFKPFATCGWAEFQMVGNMMPSCALGRFVFSAGSTQSLDPASLDPVLPLQSQSQSQDDDDDELSQPLTDWSQSNFGDSQSPNLANTLSSSDSIAAPHIPSTPAPVLRHSRTPSTSTLKHPRSPSVESPWSRKRSRTTGPESIMALGRSVAGIGKVIETVFAPPPKSSAMSPTKKVETARKMVLEDMNTGFLMSDERTRLHILFGRDVTAADAYISDGDALLRAKIGRELLNPTQNY